MPWLMYGKWIPIWESAAEHKAEHYAVIAMLSGLAIGAGSLRHPGKTKMLSFKMWMPLTQPSI